MVAAGVRNVIAARAETQAVERSVKRATATYTRLQPPPPPEEGGHRRATINEDGEVVITEEGGDKEEKEKVRNKMDIISNKAKKEKLRESVLKMREKYPGKVRVFILKSNTQFNRFSGSLQAHYFQMSKRFFCN